MMKVSSSNIFYYKNYFSSKLFPKYAADNLINFYYTARKIPQQPYESDFEKTTKHNILKIPTLGYKERILKLFQNSKERNYMKLNRIPELPEEITVLEFLPEENIKKKECTIICAHGWEGRGTNFYKFISKLIQRGFRVLTLDHPMHGNTEGKETGCHVFGFALNCVLFYIKEPIILLVHSLSNEAVSMNYYISDESTKNKIKGYVGISVLDKLTDCITNFGKLAGLDDYTTKLFLENNYEKLGIDFNFFIVSEAIKNFNYPCLIVHDEYDKEVPVECAINVSKNIPEKFQTYKINDKEFPCFYKTTGLGHRRIIRDDNVVKVVVDFISNIKI